MYSYSKIFVFFDLLKNISFPEKHQRGKELENAKLCIDTHAFHKYGPNQYGLTILLPIANRERRR